MFLRPNPILILIVLFGAMEIYRRWKQRKRARRATRTTTASSRATGSLVGAVYVGLIVALGVGMDLTHVVRDFCDV